jgi:lysozyme
MRHTNQAGVELIKRNELLVLHAYPDPGTGGEPWTIGYGHTGDVKKGDKITAHQAEAVLQVDLDRAERAVEALTAGVALNENEFAALVSFVFNCGRANLEKSTLLRKLKAGAPRAEVAAEFAKWNHAAGRVLPGPDEAPRGRAAAVFEDAVKRLALLSAAVLLSCASAKPPLAVRFADGSEKTAQAWVCTKSDDGSELRCADLAQFLAWMQAQDAIPRGPRETTEL